MQKAGIYDSLPVGIVLERRASDHPWQSESWRAVAVIPGAPPVEAWVKLDEGPDWARYHAATLTVELFGKETEGYLVNLSNAVPSVYVVLRSDEEAEPEMIVPFLATVCPYEAQDYLDSGEEIVEAVPMPPDMRAWVGCFVAEHHVDEPFYKRERKPQDPRKVGFGRPPRGATGNGRS